MSSIAYVTDNAEAGRGFCNLYAVEPKPQVVSLKDNFREANLGYITGVKPCGYVGRQAWPPRGRRGSA